MPELPEVRAHAERLDAAFAGVSLEKFTALSFHALKTFDPSPEGRERTRALLRTRDK